MAKLQSPRGTHDLFGEEINMFNHIIQTARSTSQSFGFNEVSTPIFEFSPVFQKTLGDASDIVSKEMYCFEDRGGESLTLRPEGTAGITRAFISNGLTRNIPLKWFYQGPMFRYERPQKGRTRQFHQIGVEVLGAKDYKSDIDCISLAHSLLTTLCVEQNFTLEINSLGDKESRAEFRSQLVQYLLPFKSELSEDSQKRLELNPLRILDSKDKSDQEICSGAPKLSECLNDESKKIFSDITNGLEQLKIPFVINQQLVRGLDYYTHCVFEFKSNQLGAQNTILAGGRYDQLIGRMGGPELSGVGFAAGVERLMMLAKSPQSNTSQTALLCLSESAMDDCLKLCFQLRKQGIPCEIIDSGNMSKKMKKADKMQAQLALLIGDQEVKNRTLICKNLNDSQQTEMPLSEASELITHLLSEGSSSN